MSKDFKPRDIYYVNKAFNDLYLSNISFTDSKGNSFKYFTDEEQKLREKYPAFSTLFDRYFINLSKKLSDKTDLLFDKINKIIEQIEKADENNKSFEDFPKELVDWFFGRLDKNFYYSNLNNELLFDWIIDNQDLIVNFGN